MLVGLGAAPSVVLWGALGRRIGILPAFAVASLVEAAGVAASVLWLQTMGVVIAALFLGGTFMGLTALGLIGARETGTGDPRGAIALMTASFSVGQILGPSFAGFAYDATGSWRCPSLIAVRRSGCRGGVVGRCRHLAATLVLGLGSGGRQGNAVALQDDFELAQARVGAAVQTVVQGELGARSLPRVMEEVACCRSGTTGRRAACSAPSPWWAAGERCRPTGRRRASCRRRA